MKKLNIYASMQNTEKLISIIESEFKAKKAAVSVSSSGISIVFKKLLSKEKLKISIFSKSDPEFESKLSFLSSAIKDYEDEETLDLISIQIQFLNIIIEAESESINDGSLAVLKAINVKLNGMVFLDDGSLLNNKNETVYSPDGKKLEAQLSVFAAQNVVNLPRFEESEEALARKKKSIDKLKSMDIPFISALPVIPDSKNVKLRSKDDICERAVSLLLLIQYACDVAQSGDLSKSKKIIIEMLEQYEVSDCLTPEEQEFLYADNPNVQQAIQISWQYEAYWVLIWALGYTDDLPFPCETCDCGAAIKTVTQFGFYDDFYDSAKLRGASELLDEADFIYRLDWACVDAKIKKLQLPNSINPSVVLERHRAFNWLINYKDADWDHMAMDT